VPEQDSARSAHLRPRLHTYTGHPSPAAVALRTIEKSTSAADPRRPMSATVAPLFPSSRLRAPWEHPLVGEPAGRRADPARIELVPPTRRQAQFRSREAAGAHAMTSPRTRNRPDRACPLGRPVALLPAAVDQEAEIGELFRRLSAPLGAKAPDWARRGKELIAAFKGWDRFFELQAGPFATVMGDAAKEIKWYFQ